MDFNAARSVLLCLRYGIGDVVMEMPAIEALRRRLPSSRITALGAHPATELLENDPRVDEVIRVQDWGLQHWADLGNPSIKAGIGDWLEERRFDLIFDVSHAVFAVQDVIWRRETQILDTGGALQNEALHDEGCGMEAIKKAVKAGWGLEVPSQLHPRIHLLPVDEHSAEQFLRKHLISDSSPIGLSPVASSPLKQWPAARFAAVADRLIEENRSRLLLFCGPDRKAAEALLTHMQNAKSAVNVGNMHLLRTAALLARCKVFICNDTGLMHVAAAAGTPVVALFGPTSPRIYLPCHNGSIAVDAWNDDCRYRKNASFGPPECLVSMRCLVGPGSCIHKAQMEDVLNAVRSFLR